MAIELTTSSYAELSGIRSIIQGPVPVFTIGSVSGTFSPDFNLGATQTVTLTDNSTLAAPSNGVQNARLELWIYSSNSYSLDIDALILRPSDSDLSFPKNLTNGKGYIVLLRHNGMSWMLTSFVGGY